MTRFIGILAGKGGTGKTTTAINLGAALSYFGKNVIIVDANLTTPNIGLHLGAPVVPIHIHHVLQGKNNINEAVYSHPVGPKIVPGSLSIKDLHNTNPDKLSKVIRHLTKFGPDFVIIDGAAGLGREALNAILAADELLIVTNPELPAITDALRTINLADGLNKNVLGVVLTKTLPNNMDVSIRTVEMMLERPVVSVIPFDKSVREALTMRNAVVFTHPRSKAAIGYKRLAAALIGYNYNEEFQEEHEGFFQSLLKRIGLR